LLTVPYKLLESVDASNIAIDTFIYIQTVQDL